MAARSMLLASSRSVVGASCDKPSEGSLVKLHLTQALAPPFHHRPSAVALRADQEPHLSYLSFLILSGKNGYLYLKRVEGMEGMEGMEGSDSGLEL